MADYQYADHAPPPWPHQAAFFERTRDMEYAAIFMEQRTGKSRIVVDTAAYQFAARRIDGLLILAPNGVSGNWINESIPQFMPRGIKHKMVLWRSGKMESKASVSALAELLAFDGLAVLSINYDALRLAATKAYLGKFLRKRKLLIIADESDDLGTPSAARTRVAIAAGKWGKFRRLLTGTPASETPFSLYSQTNFLKPGLLGFTSFLSFKHHYAKYEEEKGYNHNTGTEYDQICRDEEGRPVYQNLDELAEKLSAFSVRITRAECGASLPTYVPRYFDLGPKQRSAYDTLREQFRIELAQEGAVTAAMVLQRYTRLQQITSGYVPLDRPPETCPACAGTDDLCPVCEGLGVALPAPKLATFHNSRLDALCRELRGTAGQTVIWTQFTHDADHIIPMLAAMGRKAAAYNGSTTPEERLSAKAALAEGRISDLVAHPRAGGRGLDFSSARTAIFYSHTMSARLRLQAADRIANLNRKDPTTIVDLIANDTIDELIMDMHAGKATMQTAITRRII